MLNSMDIWVDEKESKVYFVYEGHLLAAAAAAQTPQKSSRTFAIARKKVFNYCLPLRQDFMPKGGEKRMAYVISVNNNESIESALRRFKRKVITEEIIKDLKKHAHFVPPGQKAKLKSENARKRNRKRFRPMRPINSKPGQGPNQNPNQNPNYNR